MSRDHVTAERHVAVYDLVLSVTVFGAHGTHMTRSHGATSESNRTHLRATIKQTPPRGLVHHENRRPCVRSCMESLVSHTHIACARPAALSPPAAPPSHSINLAPTRTYTLSLSHITSIVWRSTQRTQSIYKLRWPSLAHALERPYPSLAYPQLSNGTRPAPAISPLIYSPSPSVSGTEPSGSPRGSGISPSSRSSVSSVCSMLAPAGGGPCARERREAGW